MSCQVAQCKNMIYSPLHCMQKDHSAYLTNALSCGVFLTAGLIYCELQRIVKTTITGFVTAAQLSSPCRRGLHRERGKGGKGGGSELQIQLLAAPVLL